MRAAYPEADPEQKVDTKARPGRPARAPSASQASLSAKDKPRSTWWWSPDAELLQLDLFFNFYRNDENQFNADQMHELGQLNNIQFALNLVDHLFKNDTLNAIRSRHPIPRPLKALDEMLAKSAVKERVDTEKAREAADTAINEFKSSMQATVDKIKNDPSLDANAISPTPWR